MQFTQKNSFETYKSSISRKDEKHVSFAHGGNESVNFMFWDVFEVIRNEEYSWKKDVVADRVPFILQIKFQGCFIRKIYKSFWAFIRIIFGNLFKKI